MATDVTIAKATFDSPVYCRIGPICVPLEQGIPHGGSRSRHCRRQSSGPTGIGRYSSRWPRRDPQRLRAQSRVLTRDKRAFACAILADIDAALGTSVRPCIGGLGGLGRIKYSLFERHGDPDINRRHITSDGRSTWPPQVTPKICQPDLSLTRRMPNREFCQPETSADTVSRPFNRTNVGYLWEVCRRFRPFV